MSTFLPGMYVSRPDNACVLIMPTASMHEEIRSWDVVFNDGVKMITYDDKNKKNELFLAENAIVAADEKTIQFDDGSSWDRVDVSPYQLRYLRGAVRYTPLTVLLLWWLARIVEATYVLFSGFTHRVKGQIKKKM